jgi:hypothetical protein
MVCFERSQQMAKPNFKFQKRQKELEKKKKSEEKMQRRLERTGGQTAENPDQATEEEGD